KQALSGAWDWTINTLGSGWEWLRDTDWAATIERVKQALSGAWDWTIRSVGDAWEWLANWELGEVREIGTAILNLVIQPLGGKLEQLRQRPVMKELRAFLGTGPAAEAEVLVRRAQGERFSLADRETFIGPAREYSLAERLRLWFQDTALGRLLFRGGTAPQVEIPATLRIEQVTGLAGLSDILRAIYMAEGGSEARVPYGATGFADRGHRFALETNQRRFEELVRSLNLVEGTEDYYAAAAAVTVQHYWD